MKNKLFKTIILLILAIFISSIFTVKASSEKIKIVNGASIRTKTKTSDQGMRFTAELLSPNSEEHGFYLVYGNSSKLELINAINSNYNTLTINDKEVFKVVVEGLSTDNKFSVVITGIPEIGYLDSITVIAYVTIDGNTFYSDSVSRSFYCIAKTLEENNNGNQTTADIISSVNLKTVADFKLLADNASATIEGIINSLAANNTLSLTDSTGSVAVKINSNKTNELNFNVGDKIYIKVKKTTVNDLIVGEFSGSEHQIAIVSSNNSLQEPTLLNDLTIQTLSLNKSKLISLYNVFVKAKVIDENNNLVLTLENDLDETIELKKDIDKEFLLANKLLNLEVGDYVSIVSALLSWDNEPLIIVDKNSEIAYHYEKLERTAFVESFNNLISGSNYVAGSFVGEYNRRWNYTDTRGDEKINGLNAWTTRTGYLETTLTNGLRRLEFDYSRAFTGTGARSYEIYINDQLLEKITVNTTSDEVKHYLKDNLNYVGEVTLKIIGFGSQKKLTNLTWYDNSQLVTITFDTNGGTPEKLESQIVYSGSLMKNPNIDLKVAGHNFVSWTLDGEDFNFNELVYNDITLVARYGVSHSTYIVNYYIDDILMETEEVVLGKQLVKPIYELELNKSIVGWYKNSNYSNLWDFENDIVLEDINLYGKKEEVIYTLDHSKVGVGSSSNYLDINIEEDLGVWQGKVNGTKANIDDEFHLGSNATNNVEFIAKEGFYISKIEFKVTSNAGASRNIKNDDITLVSGINNSGFKTESHTFNINNGYYVSVVLKPNGLILYDYIKVTLKELPYDQIILDPAAPTLPYFKNYTQAHYFNVGDSWTEFDIEAYSAIDNSVVKDLYRDTTLPNEFSKGGYYPVTYVAVDNFDNVNEHVIDIYVKEDTGHYNYSGSYISYYNGITQAANMLTFLNSLLNNTVNLKTYGEARYILDIADRDPDNHDQVILIYNRETTYGPWVTPNNWEREHVWPNSKLGIPRVVNDQANIGSDLHNLRTINGGVNGSRGNRAFAEPTDIGSISNPNNQTIGTTHYYPGYSDRGDVARILMYMNTLYGLDFSIVGDINLLLQWHLDDPVDDFELYRNEVIASFQGNRNPYIDYPDLAFSVYGEITLSSGETYYYQANIPEADLLPFRNKNKWLN